MEKTGELLLVKLGGSLITDKARPFTPRIDVIRRLAAEIRQARLARPTLRLLLGHGAGSFGHPPAAAYGTRQGVQTVGEWQGLAEVSAAAARLNRLVTDILLEVGVPVLSLQPSASVRCRDGEVVHLATDAIQAALEHGLVPLVYGDVALDEVRGGTIASTEDLFVYLSRALRPNRILLTGSAPGVLDTKGNVVPIVTPASMPALQTALDGSRETDVTGGMADKVIRMIELVAGRPGLVIQIMSGLEPGLVQRAIEAPALPAGTRIAAA